MLPIARRKRDFVPPPRTFTDAAGDWDFDASTDAAAEQREPLARDRALRQAGHGVFAPQWWEESTARAKAEWPNEPTPTYTEAEPLYTEARAKANAGRSQPMAADARTNVAEQPARPSLPPAPVKSSAFGPLRYDSRDLLALALGATAIAGQWLFHRPLGLTAVALTPLLLMALRRWDARGAIQAGMLWVLLAWAELVHALHAGDSWLVVQPQRVAALTVLAVIVLRLHAAYRGIQELSRRDPLTGLLNRRGFEELAMRELRRAERHGRPIAFALIDIDRFKQVNDRYGHAAGDRVLQLVAAQLSTLRVSDFAVRLGGDEFGLLMPETDQAGAQQLLHRLSQAVHERLRAHGWPVTLSVGVADDRVARRGGLMDALFSEADRRMYAAKARAHQAQRLG
jgi:diguanylate cyclase (GGDEF)-like protein